MIWLIRRYEPALDRHFFLAVELDDIDDPQLVWGLENEALMFGSQAQAIEVASAYEGAEVVSHYL